LYVLNDILEFDIDILKEYLDKYKKYLLENNEFFYFGAIKYYLSKMIKQFKIGDEEILELNQKFNNIDPYKNIKGMFHI